MIGLTGFKAKNIKDWALSRGYRQRVGIAQALIHDPSVLILTNQLQVSILPKLSKYGN